MSSIAVIGAGWSGLAAAVGLLQQGHRPTVFEAARQPGGRARRVTLDGRTLDNGQHILIGAYRETLALLQTLGVAEPAVLQRCPLELRYADGFHLRARRLPAPLHLALALGTVRGLGWRERLAAVRFMRALQAARFRCPAGQTVAGLLARHGQGAAANEHLWHPLCISALNTPPEIAAADVFAAVLRDSLAGDRAASDLLFPRSDLGRLLPDPALRHIEAHGGSVRLGEAVRALARTADGHAFRLNGTEESWDGVIVATAPQHAPALLRDLAPPAVTACIEALDYQPIVTCYLQYPATIALPVAMLGLTGTVQWLFDRGRLCGEPGLLAAVISAEGRHRELAAAELADRVHGEIAAALGGALPRPEWSRVITEKRATWSCAAGTQRPALQTGVPGLLLAGDYIAGEYPGTLETAVRQGLAAARAMAEHFAPA